MRYPLFLAGVVFIVGLLLTFDPQIDPLNTHRVTGRTLTAVSWAVFLFDYLASLYLSPDRRHYVRTHIPQAVGVLFPPFRILLIFHVTLEVMRNSRRAFGSRVRLYLIYVSTTVIALSSLVVMLVERNAPGATIVSYGDALWWAAETISTVGYGDMYPVTVIGRIFAVSLMVNGFLILSVLTATVSQKLVASLATDPTDNGPRDPEPEV